MHGEIRRNHFPTRRFIRKLCFCSYIIVCSTADWLRSKEGRKELVAFVGGVRNNTHIQKSVGCIF